MAKLECPDCTEVIDCCPPSGLDDYLLVGGAYLNNQISVLFQCPVGYICSPGSYPKLITILRGEIRWNPPPTPNFLPLTINCCDGPLTVQYDPNISQADYNALLQSMVDEAARRLAGCKEKAFRGKKKKQTSDAQTVLCPGGDPIFNTSGGPLSSFLPTSITISVDGKGLTLKAGAFTAETKDEANANALAFLTSKLNASLASGKLQCGVIAAPCDLSVADNTVIGTATPNPFPSHDLISFGAQPVGFYRVDYIAGAWFDNDNPSPAMYKLGGYTVLYHSVSVSNLPGFSYNCTGATQAIVETCIRSGATGLAFAHNGSGNIIGILGPQVFGARNPGFVAGAPNPTWTLTRTRKIAVPPSLRIRVKNYSSFAAARWTATFGANTTAPLAFNATAGQVQSALNAIASISSVGGVTVAGSLAAGWQVTWNNNGARALLSANVTTITFAPLFTVTQNTPGNAGTKEVQTILLTLDCATAAAGVGAEWDGTMPNLQFDSFSTIEWKADHVPGNLSLNNGNKLYTAEVRYSTGLGAVPTLAPSGCGWVLTIGEMDGGANFILLWQGIKGSNADGPGVYIKNDIADVGDGMMCRLTAGPPSVEMESY